MTRYYAGFHPSAALSQAAQACIQADKAVAAEIRRFFDLFVPELTMAFLIRPSEAIGVSRSLHKVVEGTATTIEKAWLSLLHRLLAKASDAALVECRALIARIYPDGQPAGTPFCGTQIPADLHQEMSRLLADLQDAESPTHRQAMCDALDRFADEMIENLVMPSINVFEPGFVLRKICIATQSICQSASHQVIDRVVRKLDAEKTRSLDAFIADALFKLDSAA